MSSPDSFQFTPDNVSDPARQVFLITPHATNPLPVVPKAVRADTDGTVTFKAVDSDDDVTMNVVAGEVLCIRMSHVRAAGTTATLHGMA